MATIKIYFGDFESKETFITKLTTIKNLEDVKIFEITGHTAETISRVAKNLAGYAHDVCTNNNYKAFHIQAIGIGDLNSVFISDEVLTKYFNLCIEQDKAIVL